MAKITLDDIRESADRKYGNLEIELPDGMTVTLVNALRLSKEKRKALMDLQNEANQNPEEVEEQLEETIRAVAKTKRDADLLLDAIGGDVAQLSAILEEYTRETEAGEA